MKVSFLTEPTPLFPEESTPLRPEVLKRPYFKWLNQEARFILFKKLVLLFAWCISAFKVSFSKKKKKKKKKVKNKTKKKKKKHGSKKPVLYLVLSTFSKSEVFLQVKF